MHTLPTLALFGTLGWTEVIVLALLGVLIFGKRLPEVGRSVGRSIVEFKKGLAGIDDDVKQVDRPVSERGRISRSASDDESVAAPTAESNPTKHA